VIRFRAFGYPMAEQGEDGRWVLEAPDSVQEGDWGTFRIMLGTTWDLSVDPPVEAEESDPVDITTVNDVPTVIASLQFAEPWGPTTGALRLPRLTPFDAPAWLVTGTTVDIWRVKPDTTEVIYWSGFVASIETGDGAGLTNAVTLHLLGAAFGEAMLRAHQPVMRDAARDAGQWIAYDLDTTSYARPYTPLTQFQFESATTGVTMRHRGSRGARVLDYVEEVLQLAQTPSASWTISQAYDGADRQPRKFYLRAKSEELAGAVQQNTVFAGGYGVSLSLSCDYTEAPNAVYGEGVDAATGERWRNAKYPDLFPTAPDYPDRVAGSTYPLGFGDTDDDFVEDSITQLQYGLRLGGWPDVKITGTWDDDTTTAVRAMQAAADVTVTGTIANNAGWDLVWETGDLKSDIDSGFFRPLSEVTESSKWVYTATGAIRGENDDYDGRVRVERVISYGDASKDRAILHARRLARQSISGPTWSGTVTLTSDPTDENGAGRSRLDIREGGWLRVNNLNGGTYRDFYIAGVSVSDEGNVVTLTVDEVATDLPELAARLERNRAATEDPARSFYALRSRRQRPFKDAVGWDRESSAGIVAKRPLPADQWSVIRFVGAQTGTIQAITARTTGPACTFALAIFGKEVDADDLDTLIPNPLAEDEDNYGWWSHPDNVDQLEEWYFVEAWGEFGQAAGYYPGAQNRDGEATDHPVTGRLVDALSWQFASDDPPFMWLAVYPTEACDFRADMRIVVEE
jgi:hypothetical protein